MTTPLDRLKQLVGTNTPRYLWAHSNAITPVSVNDVIDKDGKHRPGWFEVGPAVSSEYEQLGLRLTLDHRPFPLSAIVRFAVLWEGGGVLVQLASASTRERTMLITPWDQPALVVLKAK